MKPMHAFSMSIIASALISPTIQTADSRLQPCILLDWGNTLFQTHGGIMARNMGIFDLASYAISGLYGNGKKTRNRIYERLFTFLNSIPIEKTYTVPVKDANGEPVPPIMHAWLVGDMCSTHIRARITQALYEQRSLFSGKRERRIIKRLCNVIFTPELFAHSQSLISERWKLICQLSRQGYQIIVLSNWDPESFDCIYYTYYKRFKSVISGYVISGKIGIAKPNPEIFSYALKKYNLCPEQCILLDDQPENLATAESLGIHPIATPLNKKTKMIKKELDHWQLRRGVPTYTKRPA